MSVSLVARCHGVNANQLFHRRRLERDDALAAVGAGDAVVPASELEAARQQTRELQRLLGKKTLEAEIFKEAMEVAPRPEVDCALARWSSTLTTRGRPLKTVCDVLGVARSHLFERTRRSAHRRDRQRGPRPMAGDELVGELRSAVEHLPSYGYWRAAALVNR